MDKVIFLDRDGTLNEEVHYLHRPEDLRILPGVPEALRRFREAGYRLVVVTNQAGVARGYYGEEDVEALHAFMNRQLDACGAQIDRFFYCPHHPEHGIGKYRVRCHCRKPETGMFEMAERFYKVDKARSWMIGDKLIDIQAGKNYGVHTALVGTGYGAGTHEKELELLRSAGTGTAVAGKAGFIAESVTDGAAAGAETLRMPEGRLPYELYAPGLDGLAKMIINLDSCTEERNGCRQ